MSETKEISIPITVAKDEYIKELVRVTNESGLPLFFAEYILRDFVTDLHVASEKQSDADRKRYQDMLCSDKTKVE